MKTFKFVFLALLVVICCATDSYSQLSYRDLRPYSYTNTELMENIPTYSTEGVNRDSLIADAELNSEIGAPYRFASLIYIHENMYTMGKWTTLDNGDKLWQVLIYSPGARSMSFHFDDFQLPKGAEFFIYNPYDTINVLGAFTDLNNRESKNFSTAMIPSEYAVLEYFEPKDALFNGSISLHSIAHGFRAPTNNQKAYGDSDDCNNNINCPDWLDWQTVMKAVVMLAVDSGQSYASGVMVNNVTEDERNYFLTGYSILDGSEDSWIIYFRYEQPVCDSAYNGPYMTLLGSDIKASGSLSDGSFALLETTDTIPHNYDIAYAGWSIDTSTASYSHTIHHPSGDVKKISFDSSSVNNYNSYLWRTSYSPSLSSSGLVDGGSIGGPLFDTNKRIIAQLRSASVPDNICTDTSATMNAYWGKFDLSYNNNTTDSTTYLKYWLDPNNTGATTLDHLYPNNICCGSPRRGNIDSDSGDTIDIGDLIYLVDYFYSGGNVPACEHEADVDASGEIDIGDLIYLSDYIFYNSTPPAACP